jgi:hypothetical protein
LQVIPQLVPLQLAAPLAAGAGQGAQDVVPQLATLLFETHPPAQR